MNDLPSVDSGTNELQLLEFLVGDEFFGINIAKVSEIMIFTDVTKVPSSPDAVEGVFMHRDKLVTVVDLHKILGISLPAETRGLFIVCDFQQLSIAFHVTSVDGIQRLSWGQIEKPPAVTDGNGENIATGIAKMESRIVMILDFEKIVCDLNHGKEFDVAELAEFARHEEIDYNKKVIIAEDSIFLNKVMVDALKKAGFTNISSFYDGKGAWEYIEGLRDTPGEVEKVAGIISDIEMPQMDGHSLTRLIKTDKKLLHLPVLIFSSLIHENMRAHGSKAGADAQYSRAELNECIHHLIRLVSERK
ncbi:chemotaxis protein CheV [Clostridia bacterium]|nr:chemotaxis protein CheV [Clostridia bacterium]